MNRWPRRAHLLLATILVFLTACGFFGSDPQFGHQTQLQGAALITCGQECADRGQCGIAADQRTVVLGGADGPRTQDHQLFFPSGTTVSVVNSASPFLEVVATRERFQVPFYQVSAPDGRIGWVAGWCITTP
jgi:hypothetical protein